MVSDSGLDLVLGLQWAGGMAVVSDSELDLVSGVEWVQGMAWV